MSESLSYQRMEFDAASGMEPGFYVAFGDVEPGDPTAGIWHGPYPDEAAADAGAIELLSEIYKQETLLALFS